MSIFVVSGTSGAYSDRHEWLVKAFTTLRAAEEFRRQCESFTNNPPKGLTKLEKAALAPDPYGSGEEYFMTEIELVSA